MLEQQVVGSSPNFACALLVGGEVLQLALQADQFGALLLALGGKPISENEPVQVAVRLGRDGVKKGLVPRHTANHKGDDLVSIPGWSSAFTR